MDGCPICANALIGSKAKERMLKGTSKPKVIGITKKDRLSKIIGDTVIEDLNSFLHVSKMIHSNKYTYSTFENLGKSINIICNTCNIDFKMTPYRHLFLGKGCSNCRNNSVYTKDYYLSHNKPDFECYLYLVKFTSDKESFLKVGITKQTLEKRFKGSGYHDYNIEEILYKKGMFFNIFEIESNIKNSFSSFKYKPQVSFKGHTECFLLNTKESLMSTINKSL